MLVPPNFGEHAFTRAITAAWIGALCGLGVRLVLGIPWAVIAVIAVIATLAALPGLREPRADHPEVAAKRRRGVR